ncbi:hypothetical protein N665_0263s0040 [Sinapis alba]|nr:hypothetical protein N665_0263s0040 [Sinapis alba]
MEIKLTVGVGFVNVSDEIFKDAFPLWKDFLIGRFLEKAPHIAKVHAIVNKIWVLRDKAQMIDVYKINSTTMKFKIGNSITRNGVIRRAMWNIAGIPVVMAKWNPLTEDIKQETHSIPLWVHLRNVPMDMFSWKGLSFVSIQLHPETEQSQNFKIAKILVKVDLSKEMPKSMNFNIHGKETLVEYSYPWLPPKCTACGKWGHLVKACHRGKEEEGETKIETHVQNQNKETEKKGSKEKEMNAYEMEHQNGSSLKSKKRRKIQILEVVENHSLQFGSLLEMRVKEGRAEKIVNTVAHNWSFMSNYEHHRLGRILVIWGASIRMTPIFKNSQIWVLKVRYTPGGCSDYLRCRIHFVEEIQKKRRPFKFTNVVSTMEEFQPLVEEYWRETEKLYISTSSLFRLGKKLKGLKPILRSLSKENLGQLPKKAKEAYLVLCEKQKETLSCPSTEAIQEECEALEKWQRLADLEEKFYKQRSKMHWLEVVDRNNKFFHNAAKIREVRNTIREILCLDGTTATSEEGIKLEAERFFTEFLTQTPSDYATPEVETLEQLMQFKYSVEDQEM